MEIAKVLPDTSVCYCRKQMDENQMVWLKSMTLIALEFLPFVGCSASKAVQKLKPHI